MNSQAILRVEGLGHKFGDFQVLQGIDLEVNVGGITALIGPNGAGKTTFGDKRLIEIGIVLAREPEMILLDEPTAGMNPEETDISPCLHLEDHLLHH